METKFRNGFDKETQKMAKENNWVMKPWDQLEEQEIQYPVYRYARYLETALPTIQFEITGYIFHETPWGIIEMVEIFTSDPITQEQIAQLRDNAETMNEEDDLDILTTYHLDAILSPHFNSLTFLTHLVL